MHPRHIFLAVFLVLFILSPFSSSSPSTISNILPRIDEDGDILEAGDGCISYDYDTARYYLWGMRYQPCIEPNNDCYCGSAGLEVCSDVGYVAPDQCCGWRNMTIAVYSSADLMSWRKEGLNILPVMQDYSTPYNAANQAYFEVCGVFSRRTGFWNLWFLNGGKPYFIATAVSRVVGGPYELVTWNTGIAGTADMYLYFNVTEDKLLLQYNGHADAYVCTIKDDFLTVDTCTVGSANNPFGYIEGGGVFQYGNSTYVMAGHGCCFCTLGSNGYVWRSDNGPTGNYTYVGDIIPLAPNGTSTTHAQQFGITPIYTTDGYIPMYIGIRFGQAPDFHKNHDPQYWYPMQFDSVNGNPMNITCLDNFTVDLAPPSAPLPVPPPPAPWYKCSFSSSGLCFEVPPNTTGSFPSSVDCAAACPLPLCQLNGTWYGVPNSTGVSVAIEQTPINETTAAVTIICHEWPSNASGYVRAGGFVTVGRGGFCGINECSGVISQYSVGGSLCAKISWYNGIWCNPEIDPQCS